MTGKAKPLRIIINSKPHKGVVSKVIGEIVLEEKVRAKPDSDGNCAACDFSDGCGGCCAPLDVDCSSMPESQEPDTKGR